MSTDEPMPFYNATALAVICADVFGPAWHDLTGDARRVLLADVEAVDAEHEDPAPRRAARTLQQRIGGSVQLANYASVLLAGERRRSDA